MTFEERKAFTFEGGINATILDFETTGLNFRTERVIEACAIKVRNSQPVGVINFMVNFGGTLKPEIVKVTGHTTQDVNEAPIHEEEALAMLDAFINGDTIIAYNGLFDLSFLDSMYQRSDYYAERYWHRYTEAGELMYDLVDPLTISRDRYPYPHKLGDMCSKLGITLEDAHSAYADTFALLDLVVRLHEEQPIQDYFNFVRYKAKYGEPEWCPAHIRLESDTKQSSTQSGITKVQKEQAKTINKMMPKIVTANKKKKVPTTISDEEV